MVKFFSYACLTKVTDDKKIMLQAFTDRRPELELTVTLTDDQRRILSEDALAFLAELCDRHCTALDALLEQRVIDQQACDSGQLPDFDPATTDLREEDWQVAPIPAEVLDRRTEITGPVDRKMIINALNSPAQVFMADFEDSSSPTWVNMIDGQKNLKDAVDRNISMSVTKPDGTVKHYALGDRTAILMVRPRGLHLTDQHIRLKGRPIPASLMDFALYLYHNHAAIESGGSQPYFYLPKLQHSREAAWWNDVISDAEELLGIASGRVKVTVLIETLPAVFQMNEILHALKSRILGLNCGRWDYIFSYIKTLAKHPDRVLPDRQLLTMDSSFLNAYSRLLIQTCHRRGAFAMGGMAAQIPVRGDDDANAAALEKVRLDKAREADAGHDGTWVAHPALEPIARAEFDRVMPPAEAANQLDRQRDDVITQQQLLSPVDDLISEAGVRSNIKVAIEYLAHWLDGNGCVPIQHLMEDAATAEIARSQLWQWHHHNARISNVSDSGQRQGQLLDRICLDQMFVEVSDELVNDGRTIRPDLIRRATSLIREVTFNDEFTAFITTRAYAFLNAKNDPSTGV